MSTVNWPMRQWLKEHRESLHVEQNQFSLAPWSPFSTCYVLRLSHAGEIHGFGVSSDLETGYTIAFSELVERASAREIGQSTNGMAAHPNLESAKESAWRELIERDALLWSWHFGGGSLPCSETPNCGKLDSEEWVFRELPSAHADYKVGLSALRKSTGGWIIACACEKNLLNALEKACREVAMVRAHQETFPIASLTLDEFYALERHTPQHHLQLCADPKYGEELSLWLKTNSRITRGSVSLAPVYSKVTTPSFLGSLEVFVVRAQEPQLLGLYFGKSPYPGRPHPLG